MAVAKGVGTILRGHNSRGHCKMAATEGKFKLNFSEKLPPPGAELVLT